MNSELNFRSEEFQVPDRIDNEVCYFLQFLSRRHPSFENSNGYGNPRPLPCHHVGNRIPQHHGLFWIYAELTANAKDGFGMGLRLIRLSRTEDRIEEAF